MFNGRLSPVPLAGPSFRAERGGVDALPLALMNQVTHIKPRPSPEQVLRRWEAVNEEERVNLGLGGLRRSGSELVAATIDSLTHNMIKVDSDSEEERVIAGPSRLRLPSRTASRPPKRPAAEILTLSDSDDDDNDSEEEAALMQALAESARMSGLEAKGKGKVRAGGGGGRAKGSSSKGKGKERQVDFVDLTSDDGPQSNSTTPPSSADEAGKESWTLDGARDFILAIVPDVELDSLTKLLVQRQPATDDAAPANFTLKVLQLIIEELFTKGYEKEGAKERERRAEEEREAKFDWLDPAARPGHNADARYNVAALKALQDEFYLYHHASVKKVWKNASLLYAPAYFAIKKLIDSDDPELKKKATANKPPVSRIKDTSSPKRKRARFEGIDLDLDELAAQAEDNSTEPTEELKREIAWVKRKLEQDAAEKLTAEEEKQREADAEAVLVALDEAAAEAGLSVECGCCYGEASPQTVAKCADGRHSFCRDCVRGYTNTRIGDRQYTLECMSTEGCQSHLLRSDVAQLVKPRSLELLDKIQQERELALAELEGWEVCPVCTEYGVCIENPDERLFRCEKVGCLAVTCRLCKREGHLGLSCKEAESESKLPSLHAVEDAMTAALVRNCPKCKSPYVKADGCNLITCSTCRAQSCYLCLKVVAGHSHFVDNRTVGANKGCALFDDTQTRNFNEVEAARVAAAAKIVEEGVDQAHLERLALERPHADARFAALAGVPGAIGVGRGRHVDRAGLAAFEAGRMEEVFEAMERAGVPIEQVRRRRMLLGGGLLPPPPGGGSPPPAALPPAADHAEARRQLALLERGQDAQRRAQAAQERLVELELRLAGQRQQQQRAERENALRERIRRERPDAEAANRRFEEALRRLAEVRAPLAGPPAPARQVAFAAQEAAMYRARGRVQDHLAAQDAARPAPAPAPAQLDPPMNARLQLVRDRERLARMEADAERLEREMGAQRRAERGEAQVQVQVQAREGARARERRRALEEAELELELGGWDAEAEFDDDLFDDEDEALMEAMAEAELLIVE